MVGTAYYAMPHRGYASEFSKATMPLEFVSVLQDRFIGIDGKYEKRAGYTPLGSTGTTVNFDALHEFIGSRDGLTVLFASGQGQIHKYVNNTWSLATSTAIFAGSSTLNTALDNMSQLFSAQMQDKIIFVNGVNRNQYSDDGGVTFKELEAIILTGTASATVTTTLDDTNVSDWTTVFVNINDLVIFPATGNCALVTGLTASSLTVTPMGSTGQGSGTQPASGAAYRIVDMVELNVIPTDVTFDNIFIGSAGTNTTQAVTNIAVVDFTQQVRVGDVLLNTTRNAFSFISGVGTNTLTLDKAITGQTSGDSFVLLKSAMPIASFVHVHYGRAYYIDARDKTLIRISGPNDPQDMTTSVNTLSSVTSDFGANQPQAEELLTLASFQQYLVAGGRRSLYVYAGTDPVQDTAITVLNFRPVGLFPQGIVSQRGLVNVGNNMVFLANDGVRSFQVGVADSENLTTANICESFKTEITKAIKNLRDTPRDMLIFHHPRRNWLMCKIGDVIYNYNYTQYYSQGEYTTGGSWSVFTGSLASQTAFLVRQNGDVIIAGAAGGVYTFDNNVFTDNGVTYSTAVTTGYLTTEEAVGRTERYKQGFYISPLFETPQTISYTISVTSDFENLGSDTTTYVSQGSGIIGEAQIGQNFTIGASSAINLPKLPLRWRGRQCQITITTSDTSGPDSIVGFYLWATIQGLR